MDQQLPRHEREHQQRGDRRRPRGPPNERRATSRHRAGDCILIAFMRSQLFITLRLVAAGTCALLLAYQTAPEALALNAYWFGLLLATALLGGHALSGRRAAAVAGEVVLAMAAAQGLW